MKYLALKLRKMLSDKYDCRKDFFPLKKKHIILQTINWWCWSSEDNRADSARLDVQCCDASMLTRISCTSTGRFKMFPAGQTGLSTSPSFSCNRISLKGETWTRSSNTCRNPPSCRFSRKQHFWRVWNLTGSAQRSDILHWSLMKWTERHLRFSKSANTAMRLFLILNQTTNAAYFQSFAVTNAQTDFVFQTGTLFSCLKL